jgi:hypothetical protein
MNDLHISNQVDPVDFRISTANKKHYNWDVKSKVDPVDFRIVSATMHSTFNRTCKGQFC